MHAAARLTAFLAIFVLSAPVFAQLGGLKDPSRIRHIEPPPIDSPGIRGFTVAGAAAQRERETRFRAIPQPANLREYMQATSSEPHHAGAPGSRKVAEYILAKYRSWGLNAWIEEHEALMPFPTERILELVGPEKYAARLDEPALAGDPDSAEPASLPTFNAYSADGDVTADLVYVNYGIPEDYEQLAKLGIDVKANRHPRYGGAARHHAEAAWERGAVAAHLLRSERRWVLPGGCYPDAHVGPGMACSAGRHGHADSWAIR